MGWIAHVPKHQESEVEVHVSGIADVNLLRYDNVLLLRANALTWTDDASVAAYFGLAGDAVYEPHIRAPRKTTVALFPSYAFIAI